jgi:mono/diheme cytochrome c family protein
MKKIGVFICGVLLAAGCHLPSPPQPPDTNEALIAKGKEIFFNETFDGNGRTCGSCHPAENNFTIDPAFIAALPADNPLFVAEFNPALKENFENPRLMREFGLILENLDGFDDLPNKFTQRGIPHLRGLRFSVESNLGPRTGWSGDGAPGDGSLRSFATGAVIQHFTKTLNRIPGVDFRLPTDEELDALEAFQLSLGRQSELTLPLPLKGTVAKRGQALFLSPTEGKCFACHFNAGANADPAVFGQNAGNQNFNTGVEDLPDQPARLTGELVPPDDGFGTPGDGTFNVPSLVEAADSGPFFHNNSIETIEGAVGFYDGESFNNSPAAQLIINATGSGIELDGTQIVEIAAFLRVINTLENIRESIEALERFAAKNFRTVQAGEDLLDSALVETGNSIRVLEGGGLHPAAVMYLKEARKLTMKAKHSIFLRARHAREAIKQQEKARNELVEAS